MTAYKKLSILIPVYNEEKTLRDIVERIRARAPKNFEIEIVVVDDGSSDRSREIMKSIQISNISFMKRTPAKERLLKQPSRKRRGTS